MKKFTSCWRHVTTLCSFISVSFSVNKLICRRLLNQLISFGRIEKWLLNTEESARLLFGSSSLFCWVFQVSLSITALTLPQGWSYDILPVLVIQLTNGTIMAKVNTCKMHSWNICSMSSSKKNKNQLNTLQLWDASVNTRVRKIKKKNMKWKLMEKLKSRPSAPSTSMTKTSQRHWASPSLSSLFSSILCSEWSSSSSSNQSSTIHTVLALHPLLMVSFSQHFSTQVSYSCSSMPTCQSMRVFILHSMFKVVYSSITRQCGIVW